MQTQRVGGGNSSVPSHFQPVTRSSLVVSTMLQSLPIWEDTYTFVSLINFAFNIIFEYVITKVQVNQKGSLTPSSGEAIILYS